LYARIDKFIKSEGFWQEKWRRFAETKKYAEEYPYGRSFDARQNWKQFVGRSMELML